jgi:hypothetical protein
MVSADAPTDVILRRWAPPPLRTLRTEEHLYAPYAP